VRDHYTKEMEYSLFTFIVTKISVTHTLIYMWTQLIKHYRKLLALNTQ